ncbi:MAG: hypothetical protein ABJA67_06460, partial [Chthonomonadales bacterium]
MRKRYGYSAFGFLAALLVLFGMASASSAQVLINPKYYPTLSIRNYHVNSDGIIRVPQPGPGGDRYFLIPIYIYNEVDTTFNPNTGGQHLEPIRSFEFQMTYLTQAMVLDTQASHGSPIVMIGADPTAAPAVGKTFFTRYSDQLVIPPVQVPPITPNPYLHCVRVTGASEVPLPLTNTSDSGSVLVYLRFKVVVSAVNASLLQLDSSKFNDHLGDSLLNSPGSFFPYTHGNFGGGQGVGGSISKGGGLVQITPQPAFELRPFSQITTTDNTNFFLTLDMVYDPTLGG